MKRSKRKKGVIKANAVYYVAMILVYLYLFGTLIYKYVNTHSLEKCILEILLILILSFMVNSTIFIPNGKKKKVKRFRVKLIKKKKQDRFKIYVAESILLSLFITTIIILLISLDVWFVNFYSIIPSNVVLAILLTVVLIFIVFFISLFIIDYLISERLVRKYRSLIK